MKTPWRCRRAQAWGRSLAGFALVNLCIVVSLGCGQKPRLCNGFRTRSEVCGDALTPVAPGDAKLLGRPGELFRRSLDARVFSARAQGPVYDEAENAFATHWDDADLANRGYCGWQGEYWGKTMLCFAGAIRHTRDAALADWCLKKAHRFVETYQHENGYLSTYANEDLLRMNPDSPDYEKHWCFNIWGQKYTLWALVELYRATGDRRCLEAAEKLMDNLVAQLKRMNVTLDKTGSWEGVSSMSILRPLLELCRDAPKPEYRALADSILAAADVGGEPKPAMNLVFDAFTDRPVVSWFDKPTVLAKAYEMMSFFEGVADYSRFTGNARAQASAEAFWSHLHLEELNPMRSVGHFDHFLGSRHRVNGMTELCDVTHWIRLSRELWKLTGETKYLDAIEEAFYNAFLAGVSPDGAWGAHIVRSHGTRHLSAPEQVGMKFHQCCPDNMLRTFYDWAETVADVARDGAWEINFYSDADISLPGAKFELRGGYPVSEEFHLRVVAGRDGRLRLRVPYWTKRMTVNGRVLEPVAGRVELFVDAGEQSFALALAMAPRVIAFNGSNSTADEATEAFTRRHFVWMTPEMEDLVRERPAAEIMRGPLVLAKGRAAGTPREETFTSETIGQQGGWHLSLAPAVPLKEVAGVWGAWGLTLEKDGDAKTIPVADFWSVSCGNDPENWFSLWF